ncbi:MAG: putative molybdopterin-binding oxidoreductase [Deltaproteobacteria bacterium]|nr:putative molybdopterin-binding oxidoreductase [Deltaproteobacteria bacterium]
MSTCHKSANFLYLTKQESEYRGWWVSRLKELRTPVFWAEGHPGNLNREDWVVEVSSLCTKPRTFTWQELIALPKSIADARLTSVTRFSVRGRWGGVKVADLLNAVQADPAAKYVRFWSFRMIYDTSIPMEVALRERTLLAYKFDGEYLEEDYGGPVRGFSPYLWGYKSAKSVVKVELMDRYISGFWEQRGYPDEALITAGKVRDMNLDGRLRPIPKGEVIRFLDE